ncbi:Interferon-related developmental regulator 1 [Aphelenchoides bicaudatus]|nr:Interferon-related developmental regulator 1 [Aphelenchoides bicaudatus]
MIFVMRMSLHNAKQKTFAVGPVRQRRSLASSAVPSVALDICLHISLCACSRSWNKANSPFCHFHPVQLQFKMGKKANRNKEKFGAVPGAYSKPGRETDESDGESVYSSVAGEYQTSILGDEEFIQNSSSSEYFAEQIDNAMDKSNNVRFQAIDQITRILRHTYMPEVLNNHKQSLCEIIEKSVRRTPDEAYRVLRMAGVLFLQLGLDIEDVADQLLDSICAAFANDSHPEELRSACAEVLGICAYFGIYRPQKRQQCLNSLRQTWSTMKLTATHAQLFTSALFSWVLLLERCESNEIEEAIKESQMKLSWYLSSNVIDMRVSAGEALAVLYELAVNNINEEFRFPNHFQLKNIFDEMAEDAVKYHGKRDKRLQKFTFRQIIDAIFNDHSPSSKVRFNKRETLDVEGCHSKLLYDMLCHVLKGDLNTHLTKNEVLRELFDLGAVLEDDDEEAKNRTQKNEQRNIYQANTKERKIHRSKQRDKKTF